MGEDTWGVGAGRGWRELQLETAVGVFKTEHSEEKKRRCFCGYRRYEGMMNECIDIIRLGSRRFKEALYEGFSCQDRVTPS